MIIYFAGWEAATSLTKLTKVKELIKNVLTSYHYNKKADWYRKERISGKNIFLDSGAFSAWSQKKYINIASYADFLNRIKDYLTAYAVLDDILDYKKTLKNQEYLESQGLNPIPCFHYGEPPELLKDYVDKYDYIALGGMVPISPPQLKFWLDDIFHKYHNTKFHGFGLTSLYLMRKYHWHSCDSSSCVAGSKFARVMFLERTISFGGDSNDIAHWNRLPEWEKEIFIKKLKDEYELDINDVITCNKTRCDVNLITYLKLEKQINDNPREKFVKKQLELF